MSFATTWLCLLREQLLPPAQDRGTSAPLLARCSAGNSIPTFFFSEAVPERINTSICVVSKLIRPAASTGAQMAVATETLWTRTQGYGVPAPTSATYPASVRSLSLQRTQHKQHTLSAAPVVCCRQGTHSMRLRCPASPANSVTKTDQKSSCQSSAASLSSHSSKELCGSNISLQGPGPCTALARQRCASAACLLSPQHGTVIDTGCLFSAAATEQGTAKQSAVGR